MSEEMNLYELLGVSSDASTDEIRKAYKKKAMKHHPDRGGSSEEFARINLAHETLTDDSKRDQYDQTGEIPLYKDIESVIKGELARLLLAVVGQMPEKTTDFVDVMRQSIKSSQAIAQAKVSELKHLQERRREAGRRFILKKDQSQPNFLAQVLESEANNLDTQINSIQVDILKMDQMFDLLDSYEYVKDELPPDQFSQLFQMYRGTHGQVG